MLNEVIPECHDLTPLNLVKGLLAGLVVVKPAGSLVQNIEYPDTCLHLNNS